MPLRRSYFCINMYHQKVKQMLRFITFVLSISTITKAQTLVGCDSVNCVTQYNPPSCLISGATLSMIGITSFNTSVNSSPFTWTSGIQESEETVESSVPTTHLKLVIFRLRLSFFFCKYLVSTYEKCSRAPESNCLIFVVLLGSKYKQFYGCIGCFGPLRTNIDYVQLLQSSKANAKTNGKRFIP